MTCSRESRLQTSIKREISRAIRLQLNLNHFQFDRCPVSIYCQCPLMHTAMYCAWWQQAAGKCRSWVHVHREGEVCWNFSGARTLLVLGPRSQNLSQDLMGSQISGAALYLSAHISSKPTQKSENAHSISPLDHCTLGILTWNERRNSQLRWLGCEPIVSRILL